MISLTGGVLFLKISAQSLKTTQSILSFPPAIFLQSLSDILVKRQNVARNGEIVVALIGEEATVKTFYKEKDHIRLQPENSSLDPIIVPNCEILGKVAGVFRKLK